MLARYDQMGVQVLEDRTVRRAMRSKECLLLIFLTTLRRRIYFEARYVAEMIDGESAPSKNRTEQAMNRTWLTPDRILLDRASKSFSVLETKASPCCPAANFKFPQA